MDKNVNDAERLKQFRKDIFVTGYKGGMAHLASCYSCLEILYALYLKGVMKFNSENTDMEDRDRLILSKGHAGLALYRILVEVGFLSMDEFRLYLQPGAHIGGEPCMRDLKGIEATTGSLGHGLSMGIGMAMAQKMNRVDAELQDTGKVVTRKGARTFVILGDGELEEGTVWEAAMSGAAFGLDNLIAILDCNEIQKMGSITKTIGMNNWKEKWDSFGWQINEVDGHDVDALAEVLIKRSNDGKPRLIIAHTVKGKGVSIMENNPNWHFKLPNNKKEMRCFKEELGIIDTELE